MTVYIEKPSLNLREELASLRNQGGYEEQQFYFDGLVTNGTFESATGWTAGGGWSISSGVATHTAGSSSNLDQTISGLVQGDVFRVQFTISGRTSGSVGVYLAGGYAGDYTTDGTYSTTITVGSALGYDLRFVGSSTFNGSLDNVSLFETDGTDVVHRMPKGWVPLHVYEDGLLQREGAAHDYEVVHDGFDYYVKPAVAPSATTQTCVIGVRK